jgi:hypothetical protein
MASTPEISGAGMRDMYIITFLGLYTVSPSSNTIAHTREEEYQSKPL